MYVLITCKLKKYRINSNRKKVETSIFRHLRADNFVVSSPARIKKIGSITTKKQWRHLFPIISLRGYFRRSRADNSLVGGPIWLKFELLLNIMHVLDTYKSKMDWINNIREKVVTSSFYRRSWAAKSVVRGKISRMS